MSSAESLRTVKVVHTAVWAFFASCVVAIPLCAALGRLALAAALIAIVLCECAVLLLNRFRCPLTAIAAQYTDDRRDNFDIFLPEWLARHNKTIFGALYIFGILATVTRWATD